MLIERFRLNGCRVIVFIFISMLIEHKQTVETLIRRRIVRRLVWVSTVCIWPAKRTLGLKWLMLECSSASIFCEGQLQRFLRAYACVQIRLSLCCTIVICMHDRMPASDMMASS